jgi:hypothetical protein
MDMLVMVASEEQEMRWPLPQDLECCCQMQLSLRNKTIDLDVGFETKNAGFATKGENLFACIQYFSM